jgi:ketosteroid isomerase-like protein
VVKQRARNALRALRSKTGWEEVSGTFRWLATRFSDCSSYDIQLVAAGASGDLAYTVAYEHTTASVEGKPRVSYKLRVTHVYRREDGEWKIVHRHGDSVPEGDADRAANAV